MQKRQVFRLVRGDDQLVGNRSEPLDKATDKRAASKRDRCLAAPHALALAASLNDHRHARAHVLRFDEVRHARHIVDAECRDAVRGGALARLGDVGDDGHRRFRGQLVGNIGMVGMLRGEMVACGRCGALRHAAPLGRRDGPAPELGEIGAERPAFARALGEHGRGACVGGVARTHDLYRGQAAFAITLNHHDVVARHACDDVVALKLAGRGLDARHLPRAGDDRLGRARMAMTVGIFSGLIDLETHMAVMLHAAHIEPSIGEL